MSEFIQVEKFGFVTLAKLHNPPHSLLCKEMVQALDQLVDQTESDDSVKVVILTSTHPDCFLAHYDVAELLNVAQKSPSLSQLQAKSTLDLIKYLKPIPPVKMILSKSPAAGVLDLQDFHQTLLKMGRSGVIYIAAINGQSAGGGLELAMACDFRYLSDQAELAQPEVLLGFPPGGGGTQRLPRLVGRAKALEIMLLGRSITAKEALEIGLVNDVIKHDELIAHCLEIANVLAKRFKSAVRVIKRAAIDGSSLPLEQGLAIEQAGFLEMLGTTQAQKAMKSYVDFIAQHGKLAALDDEAKKKLQDGNFVSFDD